MRKFIVTIGTHRVSVVISVIKLVEQYNCSSILLIDCLWCPPPPSNCSYVCRQWLLCLCFDLSNTLLQMGGSTVQNTAGILCAY